MPWSLLCIPIAVREHGKPHKFLLLMPPPALPWRFEPSVYKRVVVGCLVQCIVTPSTLCVCARIQVTFCVSSKVGSNGYDMLS